MTTSSTKRPLGDDVRDATVALCLLLTAAFVIVGLYVLVQAFVSYEGTRFTLLSLFTLGAWHLHASDVEREE